MEYKEDVTPGLLEKVQSGFKKNMLKNRKAAAVVKKVEAGKATYRDVDQYAEAVGGALQDAFAATVTSEVLPGGKMHYNIADGLIQPTLETNHEMVAAVATTVQEQLNQSAGIGLKAVSPQLDQEYIDNLKGVATSGEIYDDVARKVSTALKTYTQKVADDSVRSNFEFQSKAGLSPKIQRISTGKCCDWCDSLVGTYDYADVRKTGDDVYRRHSNCNCIVEYIPADGKGKRQDVYSKRYYSEEESAAIKARAMSLAEARATNKTASQRLSMLPKGENVTPEYMRRSTPGIGQVIIPEGLDKIEHEDEINRAIWIKDYFGGQISVLEESKDEGVKMPDYIWDGKRWELKSISSLSSVDRQIHKAMKQIGPDGGGIIIDISGRKEEKTKILAEIDLRTQKRSISTTDVMIVDGDNLVRILRHKK